MMRLAAIVDRIPRFALFTLAGLVQVALIALMVIDRASILRTGTEVTLQTRPVDPRDFLRGDYVALAYDISTVAAGELKDRLGWRKGTPLFVKLAPQPDGTYHAVSVHLDPVAVTAPEILIRGLINSRWGCGREGRAFCDFITVSYGIESYFVPQGEGLEIEKARNQGKVTVVAAVTPAGRAAIKRLLIDGKPVYDEPLF
jgi:uncharacterized membrane-anchored protein